MALVQLSCSFASLDTYPDSRRQTYMTAGSCNGSNTSSDLTLIIYSIAIYRQLHRHMIPCLWLSAVLHLCRMTVMLESVGGRFCQGWQIMGCKMFRFLGCFSIIQSCLLNLDIYGGYCFSTLVQVHTETWLDLDRRRDWLLMYVYPAKYHLEHYPTLHWTI